VDKTRTGAQARDVEYSVIPEPPTKLDAGIAELVKQVPVNFAALYEGGDPFAEVSEEPAAAGVRGGRARKAA